MLQISMICMLHISDTYVSRTLRSEGRGAEPGARCAELFEGVQNGVQDV